MSRQNRANFASANRKAKHGAKDCISASVGDQAPEGTFDGYSRASDAPAKPVSATLAHFGPPRQQTLDTVRKAIARLIRRHRLDYAAFETICKAARKETGLRRPGRSRRFPRLLPERIFVERGKGDKDRYILFPDSFRLALKSHLAANPDNVYTCSSPGTGSLTRPGGSSRSYRSTRRAPASPSTSTRTCSGTSF